jgi:hypothetical protein
MGTKDRSQAVNPAAPYIVHVHNVVNLAKVYNFTSAGNEENCIANITSPGSSEILNSYTAYKINT